MIFQRSLTPLEYLYSALWMCCVWLSFLSTFYRKARCKKFREEHYKLPQQPALRVLHRDKNYYYYCYCYCYSISQWFFWCCFYHLARTLSYRCQNLGLYFLLLMKILVSLWVWSIVMVYLVNEYSKQNAFFILKAWRGIDKV